jgi:hypothetical protein
MHDRLHPHQALDLKRIEDDGHHLSFFSTHSITPSLQDLAGRITNEMKFAKL